MANLLNALLMIPNASLQQRLEAGAQRTLEGVCCKALLGAALGSGLWRQFEPAPDFLGINGSASKPRNIKESRQAGTSVVSCKWGNRCNNIGMAMLASTRANGAPRQ
jgi:hypothetical protein